MSSTLPPEAGVAHSVRVVELAEEHRWQAQCECGWAGPLRVHALDARRDLVKHEHLAPTIDWLLGAQVVRP